MNFFRRPELLDRLAAEYMLGTLHGGARRRFEAAMQVHPDVARAVMRWQERLLPLDQATVPLRAGDALWARIAQRAFGGDVAGLADPRSAAAGRADAGKLSTPTPTPARRPTASAQPAWWQRWLGPIPSGALAMGLMLGLFAPMAWQQLQADRSDTQLPESYVGVLLTAEGQQGLIVSSLRRGRTVDFKRLRAVAVPAGQTLFLWTLDAQGLAQAVAPIRLGAFTSLALDRPAELVFTRAVELAVSIEVDGSRPTQATQPFVYRGHCGKLWRAPPPK